MTTINTSSAVRTTFDRYFSIAQDVPFNPDWANGTGYFDHACHEDFGNGRLVRFEDQHGRKAIAVSAKGGSVVIFERFKGGENDVFVVNVPHRIHGKIKLEKHYDGRMSSEMIDSLIQEVVSQAA